MWIYVIVVLVVTVALLVAIPIDILFGHKKRAFLMLITVLVGGVIGYGTLYSYTGVYSFEGDTRTTAEWGECIYFSAVTWTTLGYGDYYPSTGASKFLATFEVFAGYIFLGLLVALIANIAFSDGERLRSMELELNTVVKAINLLLKDRINAIADKEETGDQNPT